MPSHKLLKIIILMLYSQLAVPSYDALTARDRQVFQQAVKMIDEEKWQLANSLFLGLNQQNPGNRLIKNNLAVILLNLGRIKEAQDMLTEVIQHDQASAIAYQNLKKIYSYSAAKTYSEGLNLLSPIEIPDLTLLTMDLQKESLLADTAISRKQNEQSPQKIQTRNNKPEQIKQLKAAADSGAVNKLNAEADVGDAVQNQNTSSADIDKPVITKNGQTDKQITEKSAEKTPVKTLLSRLQLWKKYWSEGNSVDYIAMYRDDYAPRGQKRSRWLRNRKQKVRKDLKISIDIENPRVYISQSGNRANILFTQSYRSSTFSDRVLKRLYWIKQGGEWKIDRESIVKMM